MRVLADRLAALPVEATMQAALDAAAARLAEAVRAGLATDPGGPHDTPWRDTGALQASIAASRDGLSAVVGSTSEVAVYQERGTARIPPRPFLAPAAAAMGRELAGEVGAAVARMLDAGATVTGSDSAAANFGPSELPARRDQNLWPAQ